jgi:hypothetical protein
MNNLTAKNILTGEQLDLRNNRRQEKVTFLRPSGENHAVVINANDRTERVSVAELYTR